MTPRFRAASYPGWRGRWRALGARTGRARRAEDPSALCLSPLHAQVRHRGRATMSVYVVAQISIHDRAMYDRYVSKFMGVLARFDGRLLAADESPTVLEGSWPHQKVILIEFRDREAFERWAYSPEYADISRDRIAATT